VQKRVTKTGDHGFGLMIHAVHMGEDVPRLNEWYEDVFGGVVFMGVDEPTYLPIEKRYASLLLVSDLCVETMAPAQPVDASTPVGRFFNKFGHHLHSVGFKLDDFTGFGDRLIAAGIYLGRPGG